MSLTFRLILGRTDILLTPV